MALAVGWDRLPPDAGKPRLSSTVIILNAAFAFAQEYRADRSAERLRSLLPMSTRVRRDGQLGVIEASQLVRGATLSSLDRVTGSALTSGSLSHTPSRWMSRWSAVKASRFGTPSEIPWLPAPSWYRGREKVWSMRLAPIRPSPALLR